VGGPGGGGGGGGGGAQPKISRGAGARDWLGDMGHMAAVHRVAGGQGSVCGGGGGSCVCQFAVLPPQGDVVGVSRAAFTKGVERMEAGERETRSVCPTVLGTRVETGNGLGREAGRKWGHSRRGTTASSSSSNRESSSIPWWQQQLQKQHLQWAANHVSSPPFHH
jgi:hypothetical protein